MKLTEKDLETLLHLVTKTADESIGETRAYWNELFWKLVILETEETK